MQAINLEQAQAQLPILIEAVLNGGEILIEGEGGRLVKLVPLNDDDSRAQFGKRKTAAYLKQSYKTRATARAARPMFGSARGMIELAPDFDAPLDEFFEEYMP